MAGDHQRAKADDRRERIDQHGHGRGLRYFVFPLLVEEIVNDVHAFVDADTQQQRQRDHVGRIERDAQQPQESEGCASPTANGNMASRV